MERTPGRWIDRTRNITGKQNSMLIFLFTNVPDVDEDVERLRTLEGLVPSLYDMPKGCRFAPRCQFACPECEKERIKLLDLEDGRQVRCRRYEK